jgi:hypothetical protein
MTPEHLVDSAKLYDYYVNGLKDTNSESTHTARVHLSNVTSSLTPTPAVYSAPSLMDLLNADNVEPQSEFVDTEAMEEFWFNNPDPYDLSETDRIDPNLQEAVTRSSTRFDIAKYVKLDDGKLTSLISKVDSAGPGALMMETTSDQAKTVGKPGEWSVASFLGAP